MQNTLHRLWIGDITPQSDQSTDTPLCRQLIADMNEQRTLFCADMTAEQLQAFLKTSDAIWPEGAQGVRTVPLCSVVGTHAGPGAVVAAFFKKH